MTALALAFWLLVAVNVTVVVLALLSWHNSRRRSRLDRDRSLENLNRAFGGNRSWVDRSRL
jgi:membrane protein required for beta-lactamase induction